MAVVLEEIVPFGRSRREYELMFGLSADDMRGRILGCGDGPASFNAEAAADGCEVVSVDPIYRFSGQQIRARFYDVVDIVIDQVRRTPENWVWRFHRDPDDGRSGSR